MAETRLYEDGKKGVRHPGDPDRRIKDMNRDGVDAEIIFGILGVASRVRDHEAANEMLRIYNDWLKKFCSHYPDRQIGARGHAFDAFPCGVLSLDRVLARRARSELRSHWFLMEFGNDAMRSPKETGDGFDVQRR